VWNIQNGHNLHNMEAVDEQEVTGLLALDDKKLVIAVGWSRHIVQYHIESDVSIIPSTLFYELFPLLRSGYKRNS
jgi:hypothetical protein